MKKPLTRWHTPVSQLLSTHSYSFTPVASSIRERADDLIPRVIILLCGHVSGRQTMRVRETAV